LHILTVWPDGAKVRLLSYFFSWKCSHENDPVKGERLNSLLILPNFLEK
jgi:hypothetical protein